jgi:Mg2+-importing ATPase
VLAVTSLSIVLLAMVLPLTPLGTYFGFVAPPWRFYGILLGMTLLYLVCVQIAKTFFYRWMSTRHPRHGLRG